MRRPALMFALSGLVGALVAVPIAVYASHSFNDVPDTNTFHEDIAWLRGAGVTKGCNPPANTEFCPKEDVTREQMAAFLRRLADNQVVDAGALDGFDADALATRAETVEGPQIGNFDLHWGPSVSLTLPARGIVIASGEVPVSNSLSSVGGNCSMGTAEGPTGASLGEDWFFLNPPELPTDICRAMGAAVLEAGTYEIEFQLECAAGGDDPACSDTVALRPRVWAMWIPFGGQGNPPIP